MVTYLQESYAATNQGDSQHKGGTGKVNIHHRQWWHHSAPHAAKPAAVSKLLATAAVRAEPLPRLLRCTAAAAAQLTTARQDSSAQQHPAAMLLPGIQQLNSWSVVPADTYGPYGSLHAERAAATVPISSVSSSHQSKLATCLLHLSGC